jgi:hypothetical protein
MNMLARIMRQRHLLGTHAHLTKALHIATWKRDTCPEAAKLIEQAIKLLDEQIVIDGADNPYYHALTKAAPLAAADGEVVRKITAAIIPSN